MAGWVLRRSYVPYQLLCPIPIISIMAAVKLGAWAYPLAILIPWVAYVTHVLRHWRLEAGAS